MVRTLALALLVSILIAVASLIESYSESTCFVYLYKAYTRNGGVELCFRNTCSHTCSVELVVFSKGIPKKMVISIPAEMVKCISVTGESVMWRSSCGDTYGSIELVCVTTFTSTAIVVETATTTVVATVYTTRTTLATATSTMIRVVEKPITVPVVGGYPKTMAEAREISRARASLILYTVLLLVSIYAFSRCLRMRT